MVIVYKFSFNNNTYIGSTTLPLKHRIREHKKCTQRINKNNRLYSFCKSFKENPICENNFCILEEIHIKVDDKIRRQREQFYIDYYKPNLNMRNAYRN